MDGVIDSMDMSWNKQTNKLQTNMRWNKLPFIHISKWETVKDREPWCAAVYKVAKSQT